ncbi:MAG: zinc ribbon domain-containing protein [Bacilli bacterium]|nr:zinc ribbon domain-containing protein [Bacilli bacterium]
MNLLLVIFVLYIVFEIPICFGMGLIFKKMNLDFNRGIIPFYNKMILIKYYKLPMYHLILIFIPIVGLYTNFVIYSNLCKQCNKNFMYIIELTFFPFVYNIFLGLEMESKGVEAIDNYLEDQKSLYEKGNSDKISVDKDEYVWRPEKKIKSGSVYKATRNNVSAKVNIKPKSSNNIIDNKKQIDGVKKEHDTKVCPKCGAKMSKDASVCFLCGTKF